MPWYPCVRELTPAELQALNCLRRELSEELGPEEFVDNCDVVRFALRELEHEFRNSERDNVLGRLCFHLWNSRKKLPDKSA